MTRWSRLLALLVVFVACDVGISAATPAPSSGNVRATVAFVGDSNLVLPASAIDVALQQRDYGYLTVNAARPSAAIRMPDCRMGSSLILPPCPTHDYWKARTADLRAAVKPSIWVVDLGIVDAVAGAGTKSGPGVRSYGAKIDWLMQLLPGTVLWTNLPCSIEPSWVRAACKKVNVALAAAPTRHDNLIVVPWGRIAKGHREYMEGSFVHYSAAGRAAYAALLAHELDTRFEQP